MINNKAAIQTLWLSTKWSLIFRQTPVRRTIPGGPLPPAESGLRSGCGDTSAKSPDSSMSDCDKGNDWVALVISPLTWFVSCNSDESLCPLSAGWGARGGAQGQSWTRQGSGAPLCHLLLSPSHSLLLHAANPREYVLKICISMHMKTT